MWIAILNADLTLRSYVDAPVEVLRSELLAVNGVLHDRMAGDGRFPFAFAHYTPVPSITLPVREDLLIKELPDEQASR